MGSCVGDGHGEGEESSLVADIEVRPSKSTSHVTEISKNAK